MSAATAEIVDLNGSIRYLEGLSENIEHTRITEIDILLAGLANAELKDPDVIGNINGLRDGLAAAVDNISAALDRLKEHMTVAEQVAAVGADDVAKIDYYKAH